jgi:predicted acetyltransferase
VSIVTNLQVPGVLEVRSMREEERERFRLMTSQSFNLPRHRAALHAATPLDEAWVLAMGSDIQGALRAETVGQFFGGRSVSSVALSAVQIMPQGRGRGFGTILMNRVMSELRDRGVALSVLYPTKTGFYRSLGYEIAGAYTRYQLPILAAPRESRLPVVEAFEDDGFDLIAACYQRLGESSCGLLDRSARWWNTRVLTGAEDRPLYRYLVRNEDGEVTGYVIYSHEPEPSGFDYSYSLVCQDLVWHDRESAQALLSFAGSHLVVGVNLSWAGSVEEPLAQLMHIQQPQIQQASSWMVRLLNVPKAIEGRGYPLSLNETIDLTVTDAALPTNAGSIRIEVCDGVAKVSPIDSAAAVVDVGALAAIYTGWLPARESVRMGGLKSASVAEVEILEKMFVSPRPWCMDRF